MSKLLRFAPFLLLVLVAGLVIYLVNSSGSAPQKKNASPTLSLTLRLGNIAPSATRPALRRVTVSSGGGVTVQTSLTASPTNWVATDSRQLTNQQLSSLEAAAKGVALTPIDIAACHGIPVGDVGSTTLQIGPQQSSCPPSSANKLISLLETYLS